MIPIYRAKKIDANEFVEGYLNYTSFDNKYVSWNGNRVLYLTGLLVMKVKK